MKKIVIGLGFLMSSQAFGIKKQVLQCDTFGQVILMDGKGSYAKGNKKGSWSTEVLGNGENGVESSGTWKSEDEKESGALFLVGNRKKISGTYGKGEEPAKRKFSCKVVEVTNVYPEEKGETATQ